jgi:ElaB/YqjD/DUF883 family membrane-anchored ribosome-binding protein
MSETIADAAAPTDLDRAEKWAVERLSAVDKQVRAVLTEHPIAALACAVGIGFVVGRLLISRRSAT